MTITEPRAALETAEAPTPADEAVKTPTPDVPRSVGGKTLDERAAIIGSALGSLGLVWIVYENLLAWSGELGFVVAWWVTFVLLCAAVTSLSNPRPVVVDRVASVVVTSGAALVGLALVTIVVHIFIRGWPALHHLNFYTHDMSGVRPTAPLTEGGISHAIVGSLIQVGIAVAIALPLGVGTAIYMTEVGGRLSRIVRTVVEASTALPDILAGLFIYSLLIITFHWSKTGLTASLALTVTIIPIIARSTEVVLRVVPGGLREAGVALGASQWKVVRRVVLPTAASGVATALILGVARIVGETAPLLIVSGASTYFNTNPLKEPMNSLPLFIISSVRSGQPRYIERGYGAAAFLLGLVLVMFAIARWVARDKVKAR